MWRNYSGFALLYLILRTVLCHQHTDDIVSLQFLIGSKNLLTLVEFVAKKLLVRDFLSGILLPI